MVLGGIIGLIGNDGRADRTIEAMKLLNFRLKEIALQRSGIGMAQYLDQNPDEWKIVPASYAVQQS